MVEHSIGNGEVDSSILSGSTIHPVEIRDDGKEYSTAVGMRSARIDTDWNRSNCRTHRSCCCQRHRLRHQPPPHRVRIRDNTLGLPGSKSTGEDGRQALVRQQQWFHLLAHRAATIQLSLPVDWTGMSDRDEYRQYHHCGKYLLHVSSSAPLGRAHLRA